MGVLLLGIEAAEMDEAVLARVRELAPDMQVVMTTDKEKMATVLDEVEIAVRRVPHDLIVRAPNLRWYQQWGAGADWLLRTPEAVERPFVLTNTSGVHAIPISEHIVGMVLMFARGLHRAVRAQVRGESWEPAPDEVFELAEQTMLLVGVGAIGERTAMLAEALGMRVEGVRRDPSQGVKGVAEMYGTEQLAERLPHADVVVLTVPLTEATRRMIGAAELRAMKPSSYLINIGRGGTVDEVALAEALQAGELAGAGLDVFEEEPLPASSPLWGMENVIITAHYSGSTPKYDERAMEIFVDNLRRYRAGEALRNEVDKRAGY